MNPFWLVDNCTTEQWWLNRFQSETWKEGNCARSGHTLVVSCPKCTTRFLAMFHLPGSKRYRIFVNIAKRTHFFLSKFVVDWPALEWKVVSSGYLNTKTINLPTPLAIRNPLSGPLGCAFGNDLPKVDQGTRPDTAHSFDASSSSQNVSHCRLILTVGCATRHGPSNSSDPVRRWW